MVLGYGQQVAYSGTQALLQCWKLLVHYYPLAVPFNG
jgi:hypothetical protein